MKKIISILTAMIMTVIGSLGAAAYEEIPIRLNGSPTEMHGILVNGTTYVTFSSANSVLSEGTAEISGDMRRMRAVSSDSDVSAGAGQHYTESSGRYFGSAENLNIDGELYIPIRAIVRAYDDEIHWRAETSSVDLYTGGGSLLSGDEFYNSDDLYWLARIISAEAGAEPMLGKILVGNVVMNRVNAEQFPSTIRGVIFDTKHGVQFTPTVNGTIYNAPTEDSIIAAKICLDSYYISRAALYFLNPTLSTSLWIPQNRPYLLTVGGHDFYA